MKTFASLPSLLIVLMFVTNAFSQSSYDLRSPDGRIEVRIRTADHLRYDVVLKGQAVMENSTLSLDVEHKKLGIASKSSRRENAHVDQVVEPVVRQKFAKIRDHYNELRLNMEGDMRWSSAPTTKASPIVSKPRFPATR